MAIKTYKGKAATAYLESMLGVPNRLPPTDDVMESAFAALADELEAQDAELLQEVEDLLTVYNYVEDGGKLKIWRSPIGATVQFYREGGTVTTTMLPAAAEWVRQQEGE